MARVGRDTVLASVTGLAAFVLYVWTMYPGLIGTGDSPELQFVGGVYGTIHPPGYPLYTLLSWGFARLPIGSLAYRMNLLSGVAGGVATALLVLGGLRLGARPVVAVSAALTFATGITLWSQATLAEVYTMAAALFAGVLLALLEWERTRRPGALLAAIGLTAAGIAHHSSDMATAAPAFLLFAVMTDRRAAFERRVVVIGSVLLALGFAAYGLIPLRTWQRAAHLGSHATSLGELFHVMRGGQFGQYLFAFGPRALIEHRVGEIAGMIRAELGLAGLLLLGVGSIVLLRQAPRRALLLVLAAIGPGLFALEYDVLDVAVFLIPSFVCLWLIVAVAMEFLITQAVARGVPALAAAAVAVALPAAQLARNYRASDHHARTFEARYFGALMEALPRRSVVLADFYNVEQMLRYEILGEGYGARKDIVLSGTDVESVEAYLNKGYTLFAFEKGRHDLGSVGYRFAPLTLPDASLVDFVGRLPKGSIVALAGAVLEAPDAARAAAETLRRFGATDALAGRCFAALATIGGREGQIRSDPNAVDLASSVGSVAVQARCRPGAANVELDGKPSVRSDGGVALVVLNPAGRVVERVVADADDGLRVPFTRRAFPVYRMTGSPRCAAVGNRGWVDISSLAASGRLLLRIDDQDPYDATLELELEAARALTPRLVQAEGRGTPRLDVTAEAGGRTRTKLAVNDAGDFAAMVLDLGGAPRRARVTARVDRDQPRRALVCGVPVGGFALFAGDEASVRLPLGRDGDPYFSSGWQRPERDGPREYRWTSDREAEILIPLARPVAARLTLEATPLPDAPDPTLELSVNGTALARRPLASAWSSYEWDVPAAAWVEGLNVVHVRSPPRATADGRSLGVAVGQLRLTRTR